MIRLSLFYFLFFSSQAIFISFVPLYLKEIGFGIEEIGIILATGSVAVFFQPFWGYVSDRTQSSKKTLLFILFSTFLTSFAFFSVQSFFLIVLRFTTGSVEIFCLLFLMH